MDILNFISWIRGGRKFTTVNPSQTLLPAAVKDPKRDDQWLTGAISVDDFAAQVGPYAPAGPQGPIGPQGVPGPVGPAGLNWQGAWSPSGVYVVDDAVGFGGASWFCINNVGPSGSNPSTDTVNWALLASQGATGPQGPQGPQGPAGGSSKVFSSTLLGLAVTGTTSPTASQSFFIPANTLLSSGVLRLNWGVYRSTGISTVTTRVYINTSNTIAGATLIATGAGQPTSTTGAGSYLNNVRTIQKTNTTGYIFNSNLQASNDLGNTNQTRSAFTINNSTNLYLIFAVELSNSSDSAFIDRVLLEQF
jgi:hypothetical protein